MIFASEMELHHIANGWSCQRHLTAVVVHVNLGSRTSSRSHNACQDMVQMSERRAIQCFHRQSTGRYNAKMAIWNNESVRRDMFSSVDRSSNTVSWSQGGRAGRGKATSVWF